MESLCRASGRWAHVDGRKKGRADKSPSPKKTAIFVKIPAQAARGGGPRELSKVALQDTAAVKVTLHKAAGGFIHRLTYLSRSQFGIVSCRAVSKKPAAAALGQQVNTFVARQLAASFPALQNFHPPFWLRINSYQDPTATLLANLQMIASSEKLDG